MSTNSQTSTVDHYRINEVSNIHSPGLLIFHELLTANIERMIEIAKGPQRLCPHCKTHKTSQIVTAMLAAGIASHKCATIAEAEMVAQTGVRDIVIAYQLVGPNISRSFTLMNRFPHARFTLIFDSPSTVTQIGEAAASCGLTVPMLLDLDPGMNRTGVEPGPNALELVEMALTTPGVEFAGLHWYDGHHRQADRWERECAVLAGWQHLEQFRDRLLLNGIPTNRIVAGGTGSFPILADLEEPATLLSPGTTTLFDAQMAELFPEMGLVPALAVLTRVVSNNRSGFVTLDVGHKSCAADPPAGKRLFFPAIPDAVEVAHTEEHCVVKTARASELRLGDPVIAIPRHVCPTSALHRFANVISRGQLVDRWEILARDRYLNV
jgi:D-serine deaminase-like pyridoxal phosphate-dependent protein